MGFLDLYDGVRRIDIDAPDGSTFWVDVKEHLSKADTAEAQAALMEAEAVDGENYRADVNTAAYQEVLVTRAIKAWNLTGHDNAVMEVNRESVRSLPEGVFNTIYAAVRPKAASKEEKSKDDAKFSPRNGRRVAAGSR